MNQLKNILMNKYAVKETDLQMYGNDVAKINYQALNDNKKRGKLILLTAISPTSAGEGKTTSSIGIADALNLAGYKTVLALREPSMGPVFGLKGTATGGGECVVEPQAKINMHFTGDFHAITSANDLVSAVIDNHLYWGNDLQINPEKIIWKRCLDMNDRALRDIEMKISKTITRHENFQITAASEIMSILALAQDWDDLVQRLNRAIVAYNFNDEPVYLEQLNITGSLKAILLDAINPNIVLSKYKTPALIHCGPFANIAHGTNSVLATKLALRMADYVVTEAGFGSDLGFQKFMDIVNVQNDLLPDCVVLVVSIRALKLNGGVSERDLDELNLTALQHGFNHLEAHCDILRSYGVNFLININRFANDYDEEISLLVNYLMEKNYTYGVNEAYNLGPVGAQNLVSSLIDLTNSKNSAKMLFNANDSIKLKIEKVVNKVYKVQKLTFSLCASEKISTLENNPIFSKFPICMVKSHLTIAGNKPGENIENYTMEIRDIKVNSGAGFILVYTNNVITMPGLNRYPACEQIDVIDNKVINMK